MYSIVFEDLLDLLGEIHSLYGFRERVTPILYIEKILWSLILETR